MVKKKFVNYNQLQIINIQQHQERNFPLQLFANQRKGRVIVGVSFRLQTDMKGLGTHYAKTKSVVYF